MYQSCCHWFDSWQQPSSPWWHKWRGWCLGMHWARIPTGTWNQRHIKEEIMMEAKNHQHMEEEEEEQCHWFQAECDCEQQEELQMEADCCLQVEQEESEWQELECRVRLQMVANEMRDMSTAKFLPLQQQIECVTKEYYMVHEAITRWWPSYPLPPLCQEWSWWMLLACQSHSHEHGWEDDLNR